MGVCLGKIYFFLCGEESAPWRYNGLLVLGEKKFYGIKFFIAEGWPSEFFHEVGN
jgi:hypothetical protein